MVWKWVKGLFGNDEKADDPVEGGDTHDKDAGESDDSPSDETNQSGTKQQGDRYAAMADALVAPLVAASSEGRPDARLVDKLFSRRDAQGPPMLETLSRNDPAAAIRVLRRFQNEFPDHPELAWRLGRLYANRKERAAARTVLESLTSIEGRAADANQLIAELYAEEGDMRQAVVHYQRVLAADWARPGILEQCRRLAEYLPEAAVPAPLRIVAHEPPPGFRIEYPLGRGGFGTVYLARDQALDRPVAMKFLHDHLARRPDRVEQLFAEARLIAGMAYEGIVQLYQLDRGRRLMVMEYITHGTLADRLATGRPLNIAAALGCAAQVCQTLSVVHAQGLVHRDIKPANVLFRREGEAVLGDFGIAALEDGEQTQGAGTQVYAAPEVRRLGRADRRTDIYGVGLLLVEMLTATPPPLAGRSEWVAQAAEQLPASVASPFVEWLETLLADNPDDRPDDIGVVGQLMAEAARVAAAREASTP